MNISNAIVLIALEGTRQDDGKLLIEGQLLDSFPPQITVAGSTFDLSEEEEVDNEMKYCLGHYFKRDSQDVPGGSGSKIL